MCEFRCTLYLQYFLSPMTTNFWGLWSICCICRKQNKGKKHQNYMLIIYWFNFSMKKKYLTKIFLIQAVIIQVQMMNKESIKLTVPSLKTYTTFCIIIQLNATKLQLVKLSTVYCIVHCPFFLWPLYCLSFSIYGFWLPLYMYFSLRERNGSCFFTTI
jgi:hypothetical protein